VISVDTKKKAPVGDLDHARIGQVAVCARDG
jgi:hypothetical protein